MSWMWSSPPPEDETSGPSSDPYAPPTFDTSYSAATPSAENDDSQFGSAFVDDTDITPSETDTASSPDPFLPSSSSSSSPVPDFLGSSTGASSEQAPAIDFSTLGRINPNVISANPALQQPSVDYVFAEDYKDMRKKSPAEQLTFLTGSSYLSGIIAGTSMGLAQAIPESAGKPTRLRVNAVLNAVSKRSTSLGNSFGVLALAFSLSESALYNYTHDETLTNYAAAGAMAGAIFKSTSGIRPVAMWGVGGACFALATVYASRKGYYGRGLQGVL